MKNTDILLAVAVRKSLNECPICHASLYDGFPHEKSCKLYLIEELANKIWGYSYDRILQSIDKQNNE